MIEGDRALVAAFAGNIDAAANAFTDRFEALIARRLRRFGVDSLDLPDLTNEVLLAAINQLVKCTFQGRASLETWVTGICLNKSRAYFRHRAAVRRMMAATRPHHAETPSHPTEGELDILVNEVLNAMPARLALVFTRYFLEGDPIEDIASRLQCSVWTARGLASRARRFFRSWVCESPVSTETGRGSSSRDALR